MHEWSAATAEFENSEILHLSENRPSHLQCFRQLAHVLYNPCEPFSYGMRGIQNGSYESKRDHLPSRPDFRHGTDVKFRPERELVENESLQ